MTPPKISDYSTLSLHYHTLVTIQSNCNVLKLNSLAGTTVYSANKSSW